jgi:hypothetical protein
MTLGKATARCPLRSPAAGVKIILANGDAPRTVQDHGYGAPRIARQEDAMRLTQSPSQWCASFLLLVAAGTHIPLIRGHLEEAPYVGWLFIALSVVCIALAVAVLFVDHVGVWLLSAAVCFAAVVAFLASRTVGLPQIGDDVGNWTEPLGLPAVASEALMVVLAWLHIRNLRTAGSTASRPREAG